MASKHLVIQRKAYLHLENSQLQVKQEGGSVGVPLEDVCTVTLEDLSSTVSGHLLSALSQQDVALFVCDRSHLPVGVFLPFQQHVRQLSRIQLQTELRVPFKKQIWKKIVVQKIMHQACCLQLAKKSESIDLRSMIPLVNSGDSLNYEAQAARVYFTALFGENFTRDYPGSINASLNYGYAILRGLIGRSLSMHGFIPSIGVHHQNQYNNFNLADDLIEPFRPLVDWWVFNHVNNEMEFSIEIRQKLISITQVSMKFDEMIYKVTQVIDKMVESLITSMEANDPTLFKLPVFLLHKPSND